MTYRRYAIYYAPRPGTALARFGPTWLGTDPETGAPHRMQPLPGFSMEDHTGLTQAPRKYALHGTLKPPFKLAEGTSPQDLLGAVEDLAVRQQGFTLPKPKLTALGKFLALCPAELDGRLHDLAAACVSDLDRFRAPQSAEDLAKRRAHGLSPQQEAMLAQWGYPYVMDQFRFHITLTGPLPPETQAIVMEGLEQRLADVLSAPLEILDLCVFGEPEDGTPFRLVARFPI